MCEKCCKKGHRQQDCRAAQAHPRAKQLVEEYKKQRAERSRQIRAKRRVSSQRMQNAGPDGQEFPSTAMLADFEDPNDTTSALPDFGDDDNGFFAHAAVAEADAPLISSVLPALLGALGFFAVIIAATLSDSGLPLTVLVTTLVFLATLASQFTIAPVVLWQALRLPAHRMRHWPGLPRDFLIAFLIACIWFLSMDTTRAAAFNASDMNLDEREQRVWVDSACSKSLFRSRSLLINVRPLSSHQQVKGIGNSLVTAKFQGDYPLVLKDAQGHMHLRLIKGVLLAETSGANLLGTNCLQQANVGFNVPPLRC